MFKCNCEMDILNDICKYLITVKSHALKKKNKVHICKDERTIIITNKDPLYKAFYVMFDHKAVLCLISLSFQ